MPWTPTPRHHTRSPPEKALNSDETHPNEDQLQPGRYPVCLRLAGPTGLVFETTSDLVIPSADPDTEPGVVYPIFDERIVVDGPPGRYDVRALFDRGGAAIGRAHVYVSEIPGPVAGEVVVWDSNDKLSNWLRGCGLTVDTFEPAGIGPIDRIVLVNAPDVRAEPAAFAPLLDWIAAGGTAVFLSPRAFGLNEETVHGVFSTGWLAWCPFGHAVGLKQARGCWWAVDHVVKAHPLLAGLPGRMLMDLQYYRITHPWWTYVGLDGADVVIAGLGIGTCGEEDNYWAGADLAIVPWGHGRAILSTLLIAEHVGDDPAADRLTLNLATARS